MQRLIPTPTEYVQMSWYAKRRLRQRLAATPPEPPTTPDPQQVRDLRRVIGLLSDMLTEHHRRHA